MTKTQAHTARTILFWIWTTFPLIGATNHWTGNGGDMLWTNAANWSLGAIPEATQDVFIEQTGANLVELGISAEVASLTLGGADGQAGLDTSAGSLQCDNAATILSNATLIMAGGFSVPGTFTSYGSIAVPPGLGTIVLHLNTGFQNFGIVRVGTNSILEFVPAMIALVYFRDGTIFDGGGIVRFPGVEFPVVHFTGSMVVSNTVELDLASADTTGEADGPMVWSGPGLLRWKSGSISQATFNPGLRVEITGPDFKSFGGPCTNFSTIRFMATSVYGGWPNYSPATFNNYGCLLIETNLAFKTSISGTLNNFGTILAPSDKGTINLSIDLEFNNYGTIRVEGNSVLNLAPLTPSAVFRTGTIFEGNGLIRFPDQYPFVQFTCEGNMTANCTVELDTFADGLQGHSVWTGSGLFRWKSGFMATATFGPGFQVEVTSDRYKICQGPCTNQGTLRWLATSQLHNAGGSPSVGFFNSGLFSIETNCNWDASIGFNNLPGGVIRHHAAQSSLGDLTNNGTVQIDTGVLSIRSGVFAAGGTHQLGLSGYAAGTGFGQISAQSLVLNGSLVVTLTNGFVPTNGSSFTVASNVSRTGQFVSATFPSLPSNLTWRVSYATNAITLKVVSSTTLAGGMSSANGMFQFMLNGAVGSAYLIQASTNLMDWVTILTNGPFPGTLTITDTNTANFSRRFYRGRILD